jgi:hypothetical protein
MGREFFDLTSGYEPPAKPEGHDMTDMPVCPYCGHEMACTADLLTQAGIEVGDGRGLCGECGRVYEVTLFVTHAFTTRPIKGA